MAGMIDPGLDAGVNVREADLVLAKGLPTTPETAAEVTDIAGLEAPVCGIDHKAEPWNPRSHRRDLCVSVWRMPPWISRRPCSMPKARVALPGSAIYARPTRPSTS